MSDGSDALMLEALAALGGNVLQPDLGPVLGYDEDNPVPDPSTGTVYTEARPFRPAGTVVGRQTMPGPIYYENVLQGLRSLDREAQATLALEMFAFVPGAYGDIDEIFRPDEEGGGLNDDAYNDAVRQTLYLAQQFGPEGIASNPLYLDILMGDNNRDAGELQAAFLKRLQGAAAKKRGGGGGGGGGRIINYIDPVALSRAAKDGFAGVTGRKATKAEQQAFVKTIHGLQSTGATGIDVAGRAEAFAQSSSPVEAKAMEYAGAAQSVMSVLGLGNG